MKLPCQAAKCRFAKKRFKATIGTDQKMNRRKQNGRNTTLRDVAQQSGFSAATVSIVLNQAPLARYIPEQTRAHIEQAAKKLGYQPNLLARSLRSRRNRILGVLVF